MNVLQPARARATNDKPRRYAAFPDQLQCYKYIRWLAKFLRMRVRFQVPRNAPEIDRCQDTKSHFTLQMPTCFQELADTAPDIQYPRQALTPLAVSASALSQ